MSERPDADTTTTQAKAPAVTMPPEKKPEPHPTTYSPPAKPGEVIKKPDWPENDTGQQKKDWDGSDKYPDKYVMTRHVGGLITLTDPDRISATWDPANKQWIDSDGKPMPEGWENGHYPATQVSGPAHTGGMAPPPQE